MKLPTKEDRQLATEQGYAKGEEARKKLIALFKKLFGKN